MSERIAFATDGFAVVVVQHPTTKKWLAVNESRKRGWWLPAGHVDRGQTFIEAAHRETIEEAGLEIKLLGLLAVEHTLVGDSRARQRVVFYAHPRNPDAPPKSVPDAESEGAAWMTVPELEEKATWPPPRGLRGKELLHWAKYLEQGGEIAPLGILQEETDGPGAALLASLGSVTRNTEAQRPQESASAGNTDKVPGAPTSTPDADSDLKSALTRWSQDPRSSATAVESIKAVLLKGANPNTTWTATEDATLHQKQWTVLHFAVCCGDTALPVVRALLLAGADPNKMTHKKRTPLWMAAQRALPEIVKLLRLAGGDPDAKDIDGESPRTMAPQLLV